MKKQTAPKLRQLRILSRSACAIALLCAATASAQVAATPNQPPPEAAPTASPSTRSANEAETMERIVVTANKREENIQEVPSSVSAINDVELENLHATQLTNYAPYVPGLQVNSGGAPGETQIALRGLAALQAGSSVATYIDETPVGSSGLYQQASLPTARSLALRYQARGNPARSAGNSLWSELHRRPGEICDPGPGPERS